MRKWKWNAADYADHSGAQEQWARELMTKLALQGFEAILDIGCGDGKVTTQLARLVPQGKVLGIDASENMIQLASERFPPSDHPNLSFQVMEASALDLSERFHVAFSSAVLHWVKDHPRVLRGLSNCLNPGAGILFQMGGRGNAEDVFTVMEKVRCRPRWQGYFQGFSSPYYFYGPEEYQDWLKVCGFRPLRLEMIPKDMGHKGIAGFKGWLRTTWFPYTDRLPPGKRDLFLEEVMGSYLKDHPVDPSGNPHVRMIRLEVEAVFP